jgi:hypothetical protein
MTAARANATLSPSFPYLRFASLGVASQRSPRFGAPRFIRHRDESARCSELHRHERDSLTMIVTNRVTNRGYWIALRPVELASAIARPQRTPRSDTINSSAWAHRRTDSTMIAPMGITSARFG